MELYPTTIYGFDNGSMTLDASVEESHEVTATITKHPIEYGANITDHMIVEPRSFTLKGRISDTPLVARSGDILTGSLSRHIEAWDALQTLMFNKASVTIETGLKLYENVVLESLRAIQDWKTSRVLDFEAVFREIFIVGLPVFTNTEEGSLPSPKAEVFDQATIVVNAGQLATTDYSTWATPEQFFSQTNIPDFRNVGQR